jgi:hypothetical protein
MEFKHIMAAEDFAVATTTSWKHTAINVIEKL